MIIATITKRKSPLKTLKVSILFMVLNLFCVMGTRFNVSLCLYTQNIMKNAVHSVFNTAEHYILDILHALINIGDLINQKEELNKLKIENQALTTRLRAMEKFEEENISLHSMLAKTRNKTPYQALARVLLSSSHPYLRSLVIETGSDTFEIGQAVVTDDGLVGVISEVQDKFANIRLINDMRSNIPVSIEGGPTGVLSGSHSGHTTIKMLSGIDDIKEGMEVKTIADGKNIPSDIPIGTIQRIHEDYVDIQLHSDLHPIHVMILPNLQKEL